MVEILMAGDCWEENMELDGHAKWLCSLYCVHCDRGGWVRATDLSLSHCGKSHQW
jgi:hypothetical protein